MGTPFVGEIRMVGFNFAPQGWATCDGQLMAIAQNEALFNLIGTTYGGDGQTTFALPDLRGRVPIHVGGNFVPGQSGGTEAETLQLGALPVHSHRAQAETANGTQASPQGNVWAASALGQYTTTAATQAMRAGLIDPAGGGQPHDNMMPYLTITFILALFGIFPSQS